MSDFWQVFWLSIEVFFFLAYLIVLFQVVGDLIRDRSVSGLVKAVWVFFLVAFPLITALVYLIVRGGGMSVRQAEASDAAEQRAREYIRSVAGTGPAQEIAEAKGLLDSGTISQDEFDRLKAAALAG